MFFRSIFLLTYARICSWIPRVSTSDACIDISVFKCGLAVHVGETRRICTYFRKGFPPWCLFPLLCMIAVYDIAYQRQVVGVIWRIKLAGGVGGTHRSGWTRHALHVENKKCKASSCIAAESSPSRREIFSLTRKPRLWWAFTITVVHLKGCVVCPNPRSGCSGCSGVQSGFCVQRVT